MKVKVDQVSWDNPEFVDAHGDPIFYLPEVKPVNVVIGANNSRKSRLMRCLMRSERIKILADDSLNLHERELDRLSLEFVEITKNISGFGNGFTVDFNGTTPRFSYGTPSEHVMEIHQRVRNDLDYSNAVGSFSKERVSALIRDLKQHISNPAGSTDEEIKRFTRCGEILYLCAYFRDKENFNITKGLGTDPWLYINPNITSDNKDVLSFIHDLSRVLFGVKDYKSMVSKTVYIPNLRGSVTLAGNVSPDVYESSVRSFYPDIVRGVEISTGLSLYDKLKQMRLGRKASRTRIDSFEKFISRSFFNNRGVELMPLESTQSVQRSISVLVDGEEERELHELGSGIQNLITLLYPLYFAESGSTIIIEEPETNLHPGYQRLFLETLVTDPEIVKLNLTIFLTTHSNHLLNVAGEYDSLSYYLLRNVTSKVSMIQNVKSRDIILLTELGVDNSSVLIANCSVWVEGPTDAKYIRKALYLFAHVNKRKILLEDLDFSFILYGGSLVANYHFIDASEADDGSFGKDKINGLLLSNRIILVADRDIETRIETFKKLSSSKSNQFKFMTTPGVEIESSLGEHHIIKGLSAISKSSEQDVRDNFNFQPNKKLGKCVKRSSQKFVVLFDKSTGTLQSYYKNRFCDKVTENMDWELLSDDFKNLIGDIYNQVTEYNNNINTKK